MGVPMASETQHSPGRGRAAVHHHPVGGRAAVARQQAHRGAPVVARARVVRGRRIGVVLGAGVVAVNNAFQCPLPDNSLNPYHGKPCAKGYDAHYSPSKKELVVFNPKQILPCFVLEMTKVEYSSRGCGDYYGDDFPEDYPELLQVRCCAARFA